MSVGRSCSVKLTDYNWTIAMAERVTESVAINAAAEATYGELWHEARAAAKDSAEVSGTAGRAGDALDAMRHGIDTQDPTEVRTWVRAVLDSVRS